HDAGSAASPKRWNSSAGGGETPAPIPIRSGKARVRIGVGRALQAVGRSSEEHADRKQGAGIGGGRSGRTVEVRKRSSALGAVNLAGGGVACRLSQDHPCVAERGGGLARP